MQLTGSEIVIECLKEQGVDTVFGYPGGAILNVYDELYKHQNEIKHILTSHEQGAAHAADGYARATGKVGVCLATSGPGATNLVTGIATAYMDSIPIVAITCNVGVSLLGKDSFQEIDITGITLPITKHNFIVKDVNNLAATIRKAFAIAKKGRPGPVLIDIPKDVTANKAEYVKEKPIAVEPSQNICETQLDTAVEMIKEAKKPYIFVGGGAILSGASEELYTFAKKVDAPVTDSLMGKGAFPGTDPLYTGMLGMHGTKTSNYGVSECDLLIVIGARFSDRVTGNAQKFAQNAKIIQIDVDVAEMNKNVMITAGVVGDIKVVLDRLNERLEQQDHAEWVTKIQEYKEKYPLVYHKDVLSGPFVVEEIYRQTKGEAIISTEVGQHQMWAAQFYKYTKPRTFLTSGGLGTMGYGLGAALGAKSGREDKVVVNIAGDGCFRMNMNEIATAVRHNIPVIQVVINNHVLGMVRQWQNLFYGQRYSATVLNDAVDFVKLAEAMGAEYDFVQFHPSYDYTDFVEGLRPTPPDNRGNIGFERKDGAFKKFCIKAIKVKQSSSAYKSVSDALLSFKEDLKQKDNIVISSFRSNTIIKTSLSSTNCISVPEKSGWSVSDKKMLTYIETGICHENDTYTKSIGDYIKEHYLNSVLADVKPIKKFVFIIDEINRGEISKIFGELFYSIDSGYRGKKGIVQTQYQNMITDETDLFYDGFYVPDNVYIIGTMNDIDRSV